MSALVAALNKSCQRLPRDGAPNLGEWHHGFSRIGAFPDFLCIYPCPYAGASRVGGAGGGRNLIELDRATLTYSRGAAAVEALKETSLCIGQGEFIALVGPSGCGKSTILKLIGGLLRPSGGYVFVGDREVGAQDVRVGMAFQNPTLLPWLTVRQNVMLPLKIAVPFRREWRRKKHSEYRLRADRLLGMVGLADFAEHYPWQLSGGMQQRASLCRALIHDPTLLLLDEPFGALDQFTREELWDTLQKLWLEKGPTVILVTHDLRESAYLADRVIVMSARPGRIIDDRSIHFKRPRDLDVTFDPAFVSITHDLREQIIEARSILWSEA
jgi:NitT/TauT family transport system ATP-binding protein